VSSSSSSLNHKHALFLSKPFYTKLQVCDLLRTFSQRKHPTSARELGPCSKWCRKYGIVEEILDWPWRTWWLEDQGVTWPWGVVVEMVELVEAMVVVCEAVEAGVVVWEVGKVMVGEEGAFIPPHRQKSDHGLPELYLNTC
jgi:hypothetical protein